MTLSAISNSSETIQLISKSGKTYGVSSPTLYREDGLKRCYLFSFHKSGSSLMDNLIRGYCQKIQVPVFSLYDEAFNQGVRTQDIRSDARPLICRNGMIYTGFRHFPKFKIKLTNEKTVLLVRDPRDMLVSLYYSVAKSHIVPEGHSGFLRKRRHASTKSVDQFVIDKASWYAQNFQEYQEKLASSNLTVYRYEDVIYHKRAWLADMIQIIGIEDDKSIRNRIADSQDIIPSREDVSAHIRQVHPGNFKTKLQTTTIDKITDTLSDFLETYNYT